MIAAQGLPIERACALLGVSVSGYYSWLSRPRSARSIRHGGLSGVIGEVHARSRQTYRAKRVHGELTLGRGIAVCRQTVETLMRRAGLRGISGRPKYRKAPNMATASDLVDRDFARTEPDRLWVTDITEHPTREPKVYCAVVPGHLQPPRRGLVDRLPARSVTGHQRLGNGDRGPQPDTGRDRDPQRPPHPDRLLGIHPTRCRLRAAALDGVGRGLLRQRDDRIVLVPDASRTARPQTPAHTHRIGQRDLRIPGDMAQPAATPHLPWHADTGRVRNSTPTQTGSMNPVIRLHRTQGPPEPPTNPGRFNRWIQAKGAGRVVPDAQGFQARGPSLLQLELPVDLWGADRMSAQRTDLPLQLVDEF